MSVDERLLSSENSGIDANEIVDEARDGQVDREKVENPEGLVTEVTRRVNPGFKTKKERPTSPPDGSITETRKEGR